MKYDDIGFRGVYRQFVVFPKNKTTTVAAKNFPKIEEANCILGYGYIDREAGLTVEVLAGGIQKGDSFRFFDTTVEIKSMLRIGSVKEDDFWIINDEDGGLADRYKEKLDILKGYDASEEVEETRSMGFLDECRNAEYPDDIMVILVKEGLEPEGCWTRLTGIGDHFLVGDLINEPYQDFGYHLGEMIGIFVQKNEDGSIICYSDMNPSKELTAEDLEDGSLLKEAVTKFNTDRTEGNFVEIMELLRDSYVWIPCNAILSERDQENIIRMLEEKGDDFVGSEIQNADNVRLVPDILQNGEDYFFPIFSSVEEMGEYGNGFSKIQKHVLEAIALARNNDRKLKGLVLNAFTDPFVLEVDLFDLVEKMKSRLE